MKGYDLFLVAKIFLKLVINNVYNICEHIVLLLVFIIEELYTFNLVIIIESYLYFDI